MAKVLKTITWEEWLNSNKTALVDISTVPEQFKSDIERMNTNLRGGRSLCPRCDGTGNELFFMYRSCSRCKGTGYIK